MATGTEFFVETSIWRRVDETTVIRYRCLQDMNTKEFAVQSADFFRLPLNEKQFRFSEKQFVELFAEQFIRERCDWFESADGAIRVHDEEFS
jgi:hypothetical protein